MVLRPNGQERLATSDVPVSWVNPTLSAPYPFALATKGVEVTFPAAPTVCVFGTLKGGTGALKVNVRVIQQMNIRRTMFAERFAFSPTEAAARAALDRRARRKEGQAAEPA